MKHFTINRPVFFGSLTVVAVFLGIGIFVPKRAEQLFAQLQSAILSQFGWVYILAVGIFLASVLLLTLGRYGDLKLGPDDSEPDFPFASWIAMLFAAGMGIGLLFFAVGEPMTHFAAPPKAVPLSVEAQREAMSVTFFHWGLHAWGIYGIVGLSLAYFGFRYNLPLTIRSGFYPLLKQRINGPIGHAVDIFAICGTLFGLATSLGFGVLQISAGLNYLTGLPATITTQVVLIALITAAATWSAVSGVERGVRRLSEINLILAVLLMLFVLVVGPTEQLMRDFVQNIGLYLDTFLLRTFNIYAYEPTPWIDSWTLFYWAWWISWSPFVGMFIARISRGRTVREFVLAVLFIPAAFTFLWMTIFGNTAILIDRTMADGNLSRAVAADLPVALFRFFEYLPWPAVSSVLAVALVTIFFITSADSGSLVVDAIAAGGETQTGTLQRGIWCVLLGAIAAVLLMTGGLGALQAATISTALPFCFVMLLLVWSLFRGMQADVARQSALPSAHPNAMPGAGVTWQRRLALILNAPSREEALSFIEKSVVPALTTVARELTERGRAAEVSRNADTGAVSLTAPADGTRDFVYGVIQTDRKLPAFSAFEATRSELRHEVRTFFSDGSRGYDIYGMSGDQIIADVLVQFERYTAHCEAPSTSLYAGAPGHL